MSEAERVPSDGRQDSLMQSNRHQEKYRDIWAELILDNSDEVFPVDELIAVANQMQRLDPDMVVTDRQVQDSYRRFCEKNPQLLSDDKDAVPAAAQNTGSSAKPSRKTFKKLLTVAAVLAIVSTLFTVQASGTNLFHTLARWTASVFGFVDSDPTQITIRHSDLAMDEVRTYETPDEMIEDLGITGKFIPTWVPERFSLQTCYVQLRRAGVCICITYTSNNGELIVQCQQKESENFFLAEKDNSSVSRLVVKNIEHFLFYDHASRMEKAVWENGNYECFITGTVAQDEMEKIIKSTYGG